MILENLERLYLGALRIIILIAATIALLATVGGLLSAAPVFLRWSGIAQDETPSGGTLGQFIAEQKITETSIEADARSADATAFILPDIKTAATNVRSYLGKRGAMKEDEWARSLQNRALEMGDQGFAYAAGVKRLSGQLLQSKGKPLTERKVAELFVWHATRFQADLDTMRLTDAEANANFWLRLGGAGAAFLAFVLIVFIFLFVKIERSLRIVQTVRLAKPDDADADAEA